MSDMTIDIAKGQYTRDVVVTLNGCQNGTASAPPDGCVAYQGCDPGYPVVWCAFTGAHEPPPLSGPEVWDLFSQL